MTPCPTRLSKLQCGAHHSLIKVKEGTGNALDVLVLKKHLRSLEKDKELMKESEENKENVESKEGFCLPLMSIVVIQVLKEIRTIVADVILDAMKKIFRLTIVEKDLQT